MTRDEYIAKKKEQLDLWGSTMDVLESQILQSQEKANTVYAEKLAQLRSQRLEGSKKIQEIQEAVGETWHTLKSDAEKVWNAFKDSIHNFQAHFK